MIVKLGPPTVECSKCGFSAVVRGTWFVQEGRLVFRADGNPQPGRGPDLFSCGEGDNCELVTGLCIDGQGTVTEAEFQALRETAARTHPERYGWQL